MTNRGQSNRRSRKITLWIVFALPLLALAAATIAVGLQFRQESLDHRLVQAVKKLDAPAVNRLLVEGASANARDSGEHHWTLSKSLRSLLARFQHKQDHVVADTGNLVLAILLTNRNIYDGVDKSFDAIAAALIQHGAAIDIETDFRLTPLHISVRGGLHQTTRLLLERGANVDARDFQGRPPLWAADAEATILLLQKGATINAKDHHGNTPLCIAVVLGNARVVEILLDHGANATGTNRDGNSILYFVSAGTPNRANIIRLLNRYGAHLNKTDKETMWKLPQKRAHR
jgi:hypothetical protein